MNITCHSLFSTNYFYASSGYWRNIYPRVTGLYFPFYSPYSTYNGVSYTNILDLSTRVLVNCERIASYDSHSFFNKPFPLGVFLTF